MSVNLLASEAQPFLDYLADWLGGLRALTLSQAIPDPARTAILSVDLINGFCYEGPLSSPRVAALVSPAADLFQRAWERGVRHILLSQDTHDPAAIEFGAYPPHAVAGSHESDTVEALKELPFYKEMLVLPKNSISIGLNTGLPDWLASFPQVDNFIVVGDCTDLCIYQGAMHLLLDANSRQIQRRVIVPANCVETYDLPVAAAGQSGAFPHPGDLMHAVFLYHMALNGVEVVKEIR